MIRFLTTPARIFVRAPAWIVLGFAFGLTLLLAEFYEGFSGARDGQALGEIAAVDRAGELVVNRPWYVGLAHWLFSCFILLLSLPMCASTWVLERTESSHSPR